MPDTKSPNFNFRSLNRNTFWLELIGSPSGFSLERRIFHSISVGLIALVSFYVPYNLYAGLYVGSFSALFLGLFFFFQYYYSRYRNKAHNNTAFGLIGIIVFSINYFTNSGINGSTDLIWPAYLLLVFAITPQEQQVRWLVIYLLCFLGVHVVEYYYPAMVQHPFVVGKGQLIDRVTAFPIPVIGVYLIVKFFKISYDKERRAAEEKTIAVEKSNAQILLQKEQLEQSNMEKNKLMSIISHDLRTPLMNVQSYLELLNGNDLQESDRPMFEKSLLKSTNNAMDMLSNLLNWSKSQMDGLHVNLVPANLLKVLSSTLEIEIVHASKKGIALGYKISEELIVLADINMLQLVVRNLVSNAVKFTPSGGIINVYAEVVLNECKLTIRDSGTGISDDKQGKIFSIEAESSFGTNDEKGVGLGLVLCKEFIERQNGRIGFESKVDEGSSFFIFIPLLQQANN